MCGNRAAQFTSGDLDLGWWIDVVRLAQVDEGLARLVREAVRLRHEARFRRHHLALGRRRLLLGLAAVAEDLAEVGAALLYLLGDHVVLSGIVALEIF